MRGKVQEGRREPKQGETTLEQQNSYWDNIGKGTKMREFIDIPGFLCNA